MKILHPIFAVAALCLLAIAAPAQRSHAAAPPAPPAAKSKPVPAPATPADAPAAPRTPAAPQHVTEEAGAPLVSAQRLYDDARFQQALDLLTSALHEGGVTGDDVIAARALRARCLVKLGRRLEAKEGFKTVLRADRGFTMDPNVVPPDEMDSFRLAAQEIDSEQLEAGRRFPASIAASAGRGNCVNQDLADLASSAGVAPADDFTEHAEYAYGVRFPLRPRLSIDFEVSWLKAETEDKLPAERNAHTKYTSSAMPFVMSVVKNLSTSPHHHVNVLAGVGPLICEAILENRNSLVSGRIIPTQIVGHNQGWCFEAGIEGEQMLQPRLALTAQVRARRANSGTLHWLRSDYQIYESWPVSQLGDRSIDFSGVAATVGLRAYIGY